MNCVFDSTTLSTWYVTGIVTGFTIARVFTPKRVHQLASLIQDSIGWNTPSEPVYNEPEDEIVDEEPTSDYEASDYEASDYGSSDYGSETDVSSEGTADSTDDDTPDITVGTLVGVRLPSDQTTPYFGWGGVRPGDIGVVTEVLTNYIQHTTCYRIDFKEQPHWIALESELCVVSHQTGHPQDRPPLNPSKPAV